MINYYFTLSLYLFFLLRVFLFSIEFIESIDWLFEKKDSRFYFDFLFRFIPNILGHLF